MDLEINGYNIFNIFFITLIASMLLTMIAKKIAIHINALDIPNERKVHKNPMPRLGGLAIFGAFLIGYMLYGAVSTQMLSVLISGFLIIITGIIDDIKPIKARYKFLAQIIAAIIAVVYGELYFTNITLFGFVFEFPTWINIILSTIFIVACINIINLIDGLDGLAGGLSAIAFLAFALISWNAQWVDGTQDIAIFCFVLVGSLLGFLLYNTHPAKVFMGDTGSLSLGATLASIAIITGHELTLIIVAGVFIIETLVCIIQMTSIFLTGKKVFLMAPLHHHFEKLGWDERDIVKLFWTVGMLLSMAAIAFGVWI